MVPAFDRHILEALNQWVHVWPRFDVFVEFLSYSSLFKGVLFTVVMWWVWFSSAEPEVAMHKRQIILGILTGCLLGMFVARVLVHAFPERPRPLHNTELTLRPVRAQLVADSKDRSSFPSDHATLFFALATGFCFLSWRLGVAALLYVVVFVCLPRVYLDLHYPTDLLAGGLVGALAAVLCNLPALRQRLYAPLLAWQRRHPSPFYVGLFLMTYQIDDMFNGIRQLLSFMFGNGN
ncbi:phosphatase PAP2 family protein [Hymenobacter sp. 15J16-1T3B]|uniref:phosphatase PAP2 family protein n=1 Tax=Hymenobacter sp. 15J16-1T3B TaxID=2886941 RepID=UPI001D11EAAA|nr:phosphatase PAP2 family protein [Hymenobacter sp. 15J16-1T3B]MCC3156350.1 phosphatase PAP2 family protein [Hymenobacter sp. 15J16-1T3B]